MKEKEKMMLVVVKMFCVCLRRSERAHAVLQEQLNLLYVLFEKYCFVFERLII